MRSTASSVRNSGSVSKLLQRPSMHPHHLRGAVLHSTEVILPHGLDHQRVAIGSDLERRIPINVEQIQDRALENQAEAIPDRRKLFPESHGPYWLERCYNVTRRLQLSTGRSDAFIDEYCNNLVIT